MGAAAGLREFVAHSGARAQVRDFALTFALALGIAFRARALARISGFSFFPPLLPSFINALAGNKAFKAAALSLEGSKDSIGFADCCRSLLSSDVADVHEARSTGPYAFELCLLPAAANI